MRASSLRRPLLAAALALAVAAPARAELRISDLAVFLNDHEVTVHVVLLGTVPEAFQEGIQSGIPAHVRVTVELWQYNRYWRDRSEEHTSELQSRLHLVCRLLLEKKKHDDIRRREATR